MSKPLALIVEDVPAIGNVFSQAMKAAEFQAAFLQEQAECGAHQAR